MPPEPGGPHPECVSIDDTFRRHGASWDGLTSTDAANRLARDGPNALPAQKPATLPKSLARQFMSPLIAILAVAGGFSAAIGEWIDASFIGAVLALNALIGGIQEWRAERGAQALRKILRIQANVSRDGTSQLIDAANLVTGDLVHLEPGQSVPADLRLIRAHGFSVDESMLTGESVPVVKDATWSTTRSVPVADRINMAHAGSHAVHGRATGIVVATGLQTQLGRIALDVSRPRQEAPLLIRMRRFARTVGVAVLIAATALVAVGIARGEDVREMVLFGVAVAVSAVPEGLPVALTVALAIAATRMAKRRVIVRRLAAVEGLGSCTLVATDKTGTLTMNAMTVQEIRTVDGDVYSVTGEGFAPDGEVRAGPDRVMRGTDARLDAIAVSGVLCNEASLLRHEDSWRWQGDPTDVALLSFALKLGIEKSAEWDRAEMVHQIPFEPENQFAASIHANGTGRDIHVKGAPEVVLKMCKDIGEQAAVADAMAAAGLRVLAFARGPLHANDDLLARPANLELLGFVGMIDPPRPGVANAMAAAQAAGVRVVMITGDHPKTAASIARAVHIPVATGTVVTGAELEGMDPQRLAGMTVFARVAPHQKLEIVQAAQKSGHFVAVTGDGINDAPALRAAHIGVAMGKSGTDVTREAADIVLTDDAFPSVVAGIEEGRVAYNNVRNVVFLLVSTGAAELVLLTLALTTGSPIPLLPAQLLWLNLVTNGIQDVALGMEPKKGDEMQQPPRHPNERVFNRMMLERTMLAAAVMGVGGFLVFQWLLQAGWRVESARNALLLLMVLYENLHVGNCRSETRSQFRLSPLRNPFLLGGVLIAQSLHIASLHLPFMQVALRTEPVSIRLWLTLLAIAFSISIVFEMHKAVRRRWPARRVAWRA